MSDTTIWSPAPKEDEKVLIDVGGSAGQKFDLTPFTRAVNNVVRAQKIIRSNPYDRGAMSMIVGAAHDMQWFLKQPMPTDIGAIVRPVAQHLAGPMLEGAKTAIQLRMHAEHKLVMSPTQTLGLTFSAATGATATVTIQNPYQGSGATMSFANSLWAITALESGALANTATAAGSLFITSAIFAGHDYVQASRNAIVTGSISGTGGGTIVNTAAGSGWGWYVFASDKRERPHTTFSPWNLQGAAGIIGAVMRETGQVTFTFLNQTGSTVYVPFHVHMKASLCGSPFKEEHVQKMFVPFKDQLRASHSLAQWQPNLMRNSFNNAQNLPIIRGLDDDVSSLLDESVFAPLY